MSLSNTRVPIAKRSLRDLPRVARARKSRDTTEVRLRQTFACITRNGYPCHRFWHAYLRRKCNGPRRILGLAVTVVVVVVAVVAAAAGPTYSWRMSPEQEGAD